MFSGLPVINDHAYISHTWIQTYVIPQVLVVKLYLFLFNIILFNLT